jgi:hypothetical protein
MLNLQSPMRSKILIFADPYLLFDIMEVLYAKKLTLPIYSFNVKLNSEYSSIDMFEFY